MAISFKRCLVFLGLLISPIFLCSCHSKDLNSTAEVDKGVASEDTRFFKYNLPPAHPYGLNITKDTTMYLSSPIDYIEGESVLIVVLDVVNNQVCSETRYVKNDYFSYHPESDSNYIVYAVISKEDSSKEPEIRDIMDLMAFQESHDYDPKASDDGSTKIIPMRL